MKTLKFIVLAAIALGVGSFVWTGYAQEGADHPHAAKTYDFKDPKGVNGIGFFVNSKLEPFGGIGGGMTGTVSFDADHPDSFAGSISIDPATLAVTNARMTEVMQGNGWLNVAEHSAITVTFDKVTAAEVHEDGATVMEVDATIELMGIAIEKPLTIAAKHIPDGAAARGGADSGDLLVLRSHFSIDRKDFGIKVDMGPDKVGYEIGIVVGIAGYEK